MIVPDKKTEIYLNEPVSAQEAARLCLTGVLPASDFLRAEALCRSDGRWKRFAALTARFSAAFSLAFAVFLFTVSRWDFFYQTGGFVFPAVLFVLCACFRNRSVAADYAGIGLIGLMILVTGVVFRTNAFLYEHFFLWTVLTLLWAIPSERAGIRLSVFVLLNVTLSLYGVRFAFDKASFFISAVAFNALFLVAREKAETKFDFLHPEGFRLLPLAGMMLFLSAGAAEQCFDLRPPNSGDFFFLACFVCSAVCDRVYKNKLPDDAARRMTRFFSVAWLLILSYRCVYASGMDLPAKTALFGGLASVAAVVAFIRGRSLATPEKEEEAETAFPLRRLLASLNVSVFDPLVEPFLEKARLLNERQKAEMKKNAFFQTAFSLTVLQIAALACFAGLRFYGLEAALPLLFCGWIGVKKASSPSFVFFFKFLLWSGLFLAGGILFQRCAFAVPCLVAAGLLFCMFHPEKREERILLSFWFFVSVLAVFQKSEAVFLVPVVCLFSFAGVAGSLFPLKNVCAREASALFSVLPLFVLAGYEAAVLTGKVEPLPQTGVMSAVTFTAEMFLLIAGLRKDLDKGEGVLFVTASVGILLCALFLSAGLAGTVVLFVTAFFVNSRPVGKASAVLLFCFLLFFLLSLRLAFFKAGCVALFSSVVFGSLYLRLRTEKR